MADFDLAVAALAQAVPHIEGDFRPKYERAACHPFGCEPRSARRPNKRSHGGIRHSRRWRRLRGPVIARDDHRSAQPNGSKSTTLTTTRRTTPSLRLQALPNNGSLATHRTSSPCAYSLRGPRVSTPEPLLDEGYEHRRLGCSLSIISAAATCWQPTGANKTSLSLAQAKRRPSRRPSRGRLWCSRAISAADSSAPGPLWSRSTGLCLGRGPGSSARGPSVATPVAGAAAGDSAASRPGL